MAIFEGGLWRLTEPFPQSRIIIILSTSHGLMPAFMNISSVKTYGYSNVEAMTISDRVVVMNPVRTFSDHVERISSFCPNSICVIFDNNEGDDMRRATAPYMIGNTDWCSLTTNENGR
jgi:hypothetical protein